MPTGPVILLIHVASTNVPFTSESKDAIADIPEIKDEIELAIKEVARKLNRFVSKQGNLKKRREKEIIIEKVLPKMAEKLAETLGRDIPDINPVVAKVMGNLLVSRKIRRNESGEADVSIKVKNFSTKSVEFNLHEMIPFKAENMVPEPKVIAMGNDYDYVWKMKLSSGDSKAVTYSLESVTEDEVARFAEIVVEGIEEEMVTGAKAIKGIV